MAPTPRLDYYASLSRAAALVADHHFKDAAELLLDVGPLDARSLCALGICEFAAGQRDEGLAHVATGLTGHPGLLPYWPLHALVDVLADIETALGNQPHVPRHVRLSIRLARAEGLHQLGRTREAVEGFVGIIRQLRPVDVMSASSEHSDAEVRALVAPQPLWHSLDLGTAFVEGRTKTARVLARELLRFDLPDLRGKSVLDIGAFDGFFSFECERRGARRVVALDYHSWVTDLAGLARFAAEQRERHGSTPDLYAPPASLQNTEALPGRRAFDVARRLLGSRVETICRDFRVVPPSDLGVFDVTLFLGVLYHLTDPFAALEKLHRVTGKLAIVETQGIHEPSAIGRPIWEFYKDDRVNNDPTTWWAPNETALRDMLEAVGFGRVEIKSGADTLALSALRVPTRIRIVAHAWRR